VYQEMSNF